MKKEIFEKAIYLGTVETRNAIYSVYLVRRIGGKRSYVGVTDYEKKIIKIEHGDLLEMILTFKHELMHIWLYEHGYKEQDGGCFSFEEVCEVAAKASRFIEMNANEFQSIFLKRR